eukprot:5958698-Heterocapsa_arctica.AAC.1
MPPGSNSRARYMAHLIRRGAEAGATSWCGRPSGTPRRWQRPPDRKWTPGPGGHPSGVTPRSDGTPW